uniref:Secreted protein n=1 Tax=Angiostrongylus cantonensis TaxID=6313 RepID=A0A0K0D049_ANGCA
MKRLYSLLALFLLFIVQTDGQYYGGYPFYGYGFNPYGGYNPYSGFNPYGGFNPFGGYNPYGGYNPFGGYNPYGGYSPYGGYNPYGGYSPYGGFGNAPDASVGLNNRKLPGEEGSRNNPPNNGTSPSTQGSLREALTGAAATGLGLLASAFGKK